VAGVVTKVGKGVTNFKIGDPVFAYCRKPVVQAGSFAEYICLEAENVSPKPENLSFEEAAAIPLVGLTAWQSLFDIAELEEGQHVLIHAGAGGVGSLAIQFAKYIGATVCTTASKKNQDYVQKLGAEVVIDYTKEDFQERLKELAPEGVDLVLDCVGGDTLQRSYPCVKKGGWLITIVEPVDHERAKELDINVASAFVRPNGEQLRQIKALIEAGKVIAPEVQELPLEKALEAIEQVKTQHTRGKIVLKVK
jgi:NADPH:quinone reductase-like Zn-dependent oxidoreductase